MLKETLLFLAKHEAIRKFVETNPAARRVARRFVAGETLDEAMLVTQALNERHITVSLDHLGENVTDAAEAVRAARDYITILDCIHTQGAEANISIKLTALGLDIDAELCQANLARVLQRAREYQHLRAGGYGRLGLHAAHARPGDRGAAAYGNVGTVIQSCSTARPRISRYCSRNVSVYGW